MNILFVLYNDFTSNSASHVRSFARELGGLGHDCCVAVPFGKSTAHPSDTRWFQVVEFPELTELSSRFVNGRGPDVVHAWTPREIVRRFCEDVRARYPSLLYVHLEDNEWHILSCNLECTMKELLALPTSQLDALVPPGLSHPRRAVEFMESADGMTVIIERLCELAPAKKPVMELWPSADLDLFFPRPSDRYRSRSLGIAENCSVIVYTGNVHSANAHEVRSLYLAVAILNREGFPTTLLRAGRDYYPFLGPSENWARRYSIELGYVPHSEICSLLCLADVLVQPGKPDNFNDYRFPSKLPEFLAVGKPVILPNTNIAKYMTHRKNCYLLEQPTAIAIAEAIKEILNDRDLHARLSAGALEFFYEHLNWAKSARNLEAFYLQGQARAMPGAHENASTVDLLTASA